MTPIFSTGFDVTNKKYNFTDTFDYVAAGIALTDVTGFFEITSPDTLTRVYPATEDIDADVSLNFNSLDLPLDSLGEIQEGKAADGNPYIITYKVVITGGVDPGTFYSVPVSIDYCDICPTPDMSWVIDCLNSKITLNDVTSLPTGAVVDTRTMTLTPPVASGQSAITSGSTQLVTTQDIWTGPWQAALVLGITITLTNYTVTCAVTAYENFEVDCDLDLCSVFCCITAVDTRLQSALNKGNKSLANELEEDLNSIIELSVMYRMAIECGKTALASSYLERIKTIGNCTDDCGCSDGTPTRVVPESGSASSITVVAGTGIVVTPSGSQYTVALSPTNIAILSAIYNTEVTSVGGTVTVTSSTAGSGPATKTFDLAIPSGLVPTQKSVFVGNLEITFAAGGPIFTWLNVYNEPSSGTGQTQRFQNPTVEAYQVAANPATWTSLPALITIDDFYTGASGANGNNDFKPTFGIISVVPPSGNNGWLYSNAYHGLVMLRVENATKSDSYFNVKLTGPFSGTPELWGTFSGLYTSIICRVEIVE